MDVMLKHRYLAKNDLTKDKETEKQIGPLPQCFRPAAKKIKSQCIIRNNGDSQISGNFWFEIVTNILNALFSCKFYIVG